MIRLWLRALLFSAALSGAACGRVQPPREQDMVGGGSLGLNVTEARIAFDPVKAGGRLVLIVEPASKDATEPVELAIFADDSAREIQRLSLYPAGQAGRFLLMVPAGTTSVRVRRVARGQGGQLNLRLEQDTP